MKSKALVIFTWASSNLVFFDKLASHYLDVRKVKISHHKSWFTDNRSYLKEVCYLFRNIYIKAVNYLNKDIILFGTNLCRLLMPLLIFKSNVIFIYNEMPNLNRKSMLGLYDYITFKLLKNRIFVSSGLRERVCNEAYGVQIAGFIPNIPTCNIETNYENKIDALIYAGLISKSRFSKLALDKLSHITKKTHFIGFLQDENVLNSSTNFIYDGLMTQEESQIYQTQFQYALLVYPTDNINNDYCAPIKIYEYIMSNCVCVIVNDNIGLRCYKEKYPELFTSITEMANYTFNVDKYNTQKAEFLEKEFLLLQKSINQTALIFKI